jgi:putative serine protease PepD
MTVPVGLGEPRGPWFTSPDLDLHGENGAAGASRGQSRIMRIRRGLLAVLGVVALSAGSGAVAGGYVADDGQGRNAAAPTPAAGAAIPPDLVSAASQALPGVVSVVVERGNAMASGSGFAIDSEQHIVTNEHIIAQGGRGATVTVETPDGRQMEADVVGRDPGSDIAVLRVPESAGLRPLPLAKPGATRVGEPVLAVGSPLGLSGTVTAGIVSALDRQVRLGNGQHSAVQTDASINPGNSGGPLVNARGEVIGVTTAIATMDHNGGSIGIGFAIPIERAQQVADGIIGKGG